jgi:hypothetical protein
MGIESIPCIDIKPVLGSLHPDDLDRVESGLREALGL